MMYRSDLSWQNLMRCQIDQSQFVLHHSLGHINMPWRRTNYIIKLLIKLFLKITRWFKTFIMRFREFAKNRYFKLLSLFMLTQKLTQTFVIITYSTVLNSIHCWLTFPCATSSFWAADADFTKAAVAEAMDLAASRICSSKFRLMSASWNITLGKIWIQPKAQMVFFKTMHDF